MKQIAIAALAFAPSIISVLAAFHLASNDKDGWGWFLFAALILAGSYSYSSK